MRSNSNCLLCCAHRHLSERTEAVATICADKCRCHPRQPPQISEDSTNPWRDRVYLEASCGRRCALRWPLLFCWKSER
jgi:hypothetical protein